MATAGPLARIRIVEMAGLGPAPMACAISMIRLITAFGTGVGRKPRQE